MSPRLPPMIRPPLGFGHPTSSLAHPAQSSPGDGLGAYQRLLRLGVTGVAGTVWVTADGVAVVQDSPKVVTQRGLVGRIRRRRLSDVESADLPVSALRLDELLSELDRSQHLSLRIGSREAFEPVQQLLLNHPVTSPTDTVAHASQTFQSAEQRCWLRHHDLALLADLRPRTGARLVREQSKADAGGGLERQAAALEERDIDGLLLPHREWTGGRATLLHRFGRLALGSGAVHERELAELTDAGIDALHSEHVARMMAVIVEYYGTVSGAEPESI